MSKGPDSNPRSSRPPFPLIRNSKPMKAFVRAAVHEAREHCVVPLIVGPNRLELRSFAESVSQERDLGGIRIVDSNMPHPYELESEDVKTVIFLHGERMTKVLQRAFARSQLHHLRGVLVAFSKNPRSSTGPRNKWDEAFLKIWGNALVWPHWKQRPSDHRPLVRQIHKRLSMGGGRKAPPFAKSAAMLLHQLPFRGTDDAERAIKQALTVYIRTQSTGDLKAEHFIASNSLPSLPSVRAIPDLATASR